MSLHAFPFTFTRLDGDDFRLETPSRLYHRVPLTTQSEALIAKLLAEDLALWLRSQFQFAELFYELNARQEANDPDCTFTDPDHP